METKRILFFLRTFGSFVFVATLGYVVMVIFWGELAPHVDENIIRSSPHFTDVRLQEATHFSDIDVLFLGSSRAYRHYDTRIFNKLELETFNLGTSGQTFIQTELLVKQFLDHLDPKLVVLDIYPDMFSSDGVESTIDLVLSDTTDWEIATMVLKHKNPKAVNSLIFDGYLELRGSLPPRTDPLETRQNKYISGGYVQWDYAPAEEDPFLIKDFEIRLKQEKAFKRILEIFNKKDVEVILVQSPRQKDIHYSSEEKIPSLIKTMGADYYNFSQLEFLNDSLHFHDPYHMNQKGVVLYNRFFIDSVLYEKAETLHKKLEI